MQAITQIKELHLTRREPARQEAVRQSRVANYGCVKYPFQSHAQVRSQKKNPVIRCGVTAGQRIIPRQAGCAVPVTVFPPFAVRHSGRSSSATHHTPAHKSRCAIAGLRASGGLLHFVRPRRAPAALRLLLASAPLRSYNQGPRGRCPASAAAISLPFASAPLRQWLVSAATPGVAIGGGMAPGGRR